jgi:hypothetical protein
MESRSNTIRTKGRKVGRFLPYGSRNREVSNVCMMQNPRSSQNGPFHGRESLFLGSYLPTFLPSFLPSFDNQEQP